MQTTDCDRRSKVYMYRLSWFIWWYQWSNYTWTAQQCAFGTQSDSTQSRYPNIGLSMAPAKRFIEVLKRTDQWIGTCQADKKTCPIPAGCSGRFRICMLCESGDGANGSNDVKCNFWKVTPILFKDVQRCSKHVGSNLKFVRNNPFPISFPTSWLQSRRNNKIVLEEEMNDQGEYLRQARSITQNAE